MKGQLHTARYLLFAVVIFISVNAYAIEFSDDFSTDSRTDYTVTNTWTSGGDPQFLYDASGERLQVLTGDDVSLRFDHSMPAATDSGVAEFDFLPTTKYPYGGKITIHLMQDTENYYEIINSDGYGAGTISKVVGGQVVDSTVFTSEYTQDVNYHLKLSFSPESLQIEAFGDSLTLTADSTGLTVGELRVKINQQDAYIDNISLTSLTNGASNIEPVAEAGENQTVNEGDSVTLNGSGSTDSDGTIAGYLWEQTAGPTVSFTPDIAHPTFTAPDVDSTETLEFQLTVTDDDGATAMDTVTVTVTVMVIPPPAVTISSSVDTIFVGESATLTWSATNADTCAIEPDVGMVSVSGTAEVSPVETTTYTISATGSGGSSAANVTIEVSTPITLQITFPQDGDTLAKKEVMVEGTFTNHLGYESGITVNGVVALVDDNYFVANNVPLDQGENTIIANAIDTSGNEIEDSIMVLSDTNNQNIRLQIDPESGTAPFETKLDIVGPSPLQNSSVEITGPAESEIIENSAEAYQLNFTNPGLYIVSVSTEDADGMSYHESVAVNVYDRDELDILLKAKWDTLKDSLSASDIQGALSMFKRETQTIYEGIFTELDDLLPQIALEMQELEMIYTKGSVSVYRIKRNEIHQGQSYEITYKVYFDCLEDGIWKINRF